MAGQFPINPVLSVSIDQEAHPYESFLMAAAFTEDLCIRILESIDACGLLCIGLIFLRKCYKLDLPPIYARKTIDSCLSK